MQQYLALVWRLMTDGVLREGRNGSTRSLMGQSIAFDLRKGFPLLTTKRVPPKLPLAEMIWFLSGSTNVKDLNALGGAFWDKWAREDGELGPVYGKQWVSWENWTHTGYAAFVEDWPETINQVEDVVKRLRENPADRRMLVSAWNVADLPDMALPPCVFAHQLWCDPVSGRVDMVVYQRSVDVGVGLPFDVAGHAYLLNMYCVAGSTAGRQLTPGVLTFLMGDTHIYTNHLEALMEQMSREPRQLPRLSIAGPLGRSMDSFTLADFEVLGYDPHPTIKMEALL